ncbi:MAG: sulfotransferase domain-containing protein [Cytophagales bacterium]|nr:sulfotransferase domain-containing protein [Cytophagales bacterium]
MKNNIKKLVKKIPIIKRVQKDRAFKKKFKVEIDLLKKKHRNNSEAKSIIHFSINKAATQYVKGVLTKMSNEHGLTPVAIHDYAFLTKMPYLDSLSIKEMEQYKHIFKPRGYLYSVFGGMIEGIDNLEKYNVVLSVRDPRDILVSNYYSTALSHPVPPEKSDKREEFLEVREWARSISIDEYVLSESDKVHAVFDRYRNNLIAKYDNVGIVRYEDMVSGYRRWLAGLANKSGLKISDRLSEELLTEYEQNRVRKENKFAHVRKGVAGDYREKLREDTIEQLNDQFDGILGFFGYKKQGATMSVPVHS